MSTRNELEIALTLAVSNQKPTSEFSKFSEFYAILLASDVYCFVSVTEVGTLVRHYRKTDGTPYIPFFTSIEPKRGNPRPSGRGRIARLRSSPSFCRANIYFVNQSTNCTLTQYATPTSL
jgi:hypothetical protein